MILVETRVREGAYHKKRVSADKTLTLFCNGTPGRIRTSDHLVRSQVLYPAELRAQKLYLQTSVEMRGQEGARWCQWAS